MNSIIFQNENDFYNNKDYQKRSKFNHGRNHLLSIIENNERLKSKSFSQKYSKEKSFSNIKSINFNKLINNDLKKNSSDFNIFDKIKKINKRQILPLLGNIDKKDKILFLNNNSKIINKEKDSNPKYLYLEYKIENNKNKANNESTFIQIEPNQIILSLSKFPKIKNIFAILAKKINQRNIDLMKNDNFVSKINITDILNNLNKNKKNENTNNTNKKNSDTFNSKIDNYISSTFFSTNKEKINNYSVQDLFLLDIINKVINHSIFLHDKKNENINEDFMLKEYKNQIKKLNNFFHEKLNEKNKSGSIGLIKYDSKEKIYSLKEITFREKLRYNENLNEYKSNESYNKNNMLLYKIENKLKDKLNYFSSRIKEKNYENSLNKKLEKTITPKNQKLNLYNFDIIHKTNIIDFDEFLNKIHKQRLEIKNNNSSNNNDFLKKLLNLDKKKIKFGNHMIEEKTKLIKNKNDIFMNKISNRHSRNIYHKKMIKKRFFIKNEILKNDFNKNTIIKEKSKSEIKNGENLNKNLEESFSSIKDNDFLKSLNEKEFFKDRAKRKINVEKKGIKKEFGITKICFNKTIDRIKRIHEIQNNKIIKKQDYNFSFLNTIYGKINTKRKMKINEIDYKKELQQKGYQLLSNIFRHNSNYDSNKNISAENIFMSNRDKDSQRFYKTVDKGISTRKIW